MQHVVINDSLTNAHLFEAFKLQLAKDFEQSNFPSDFVKTLTPHYAHICEMIRLQLQHNVKRADASLNQLLYRVDISEAQVKKYLAEAGDENPLTILAELIIKRVLQKVVTKHYYKLHETITTPSEG
jgi:hypothetical protein